MASTTPDKDIARRVKTPKRPVRGPRWMLVAVALLLALALSVYLPSRVLSLGIEHVTTTAEHRTVELPDGTRVELGAASALDVQFSDSVRLVKLRSGEAFFSVKAGDTRPFTVKAGGVSVVAKGTAFNVRLADEAIALAVEEGSVEARMPPVETAPGAMEPVERQVRAGEQLVARADGTIEQGPIAPAQAGAWRRHRPYADGASVGETIAHLRRYHGGWIVVTDDNLLRQRFSGFYDLRDPVGSLRAVVGPFGAKVRSISALIIVSTP
jgi:transmembrane sensor